MHVLRSGIEHLFIIIARRYPRHLQLMVYLFYSSRIGRVIRCYYHNDMSGDLGEDPCVCRSSSLRSHHPCFCQREVNVCVIGADLELMRYLFTGLSTLALPGDRFM